jgi:hypothetical protein
VSTQLPIACPERSSCAWSQHARKHFPASGITRAATRHGPAKYLPGTSLSAIREIETSTVRVGTSSRLATKAEYVREVGKVIGWDAGQDATLSYAECSGGDTWGRTFHGRPMAATNRKVEEGP